MAKHIKLGRPTIFIFHAKRYGNIRMDTALTGALDAGGVWKNCNFLQISCFILEMIQDMATVSIERQ